MSKITYLDHNQEDDFKKIENFKREELDSIRRNFIESKIGEISVVHFREKDGLYYFQTRLKKNGHILPDEKFLEECSSKDKYKAKSKMINKLRKKLKDMKCIFKNPIHKRKERYSFVY